MSSSSEDESDVAKLQDSNENGDLLPSMLPSKDEESDSDDTDSSAGVALGAPDSEEEEMNDDDDEEDLSPEEDEYGSNWGADYLGRGEERERILALPERKREEIIYERSEKRRERQLRIAARARASRKKNAAQPAPRRRRTRRSQGLIPATDMEWAQQGPLDSLMEKRDELKKQRKRKRQAARQEKKDDDESYEEGDDFALEPEDDEPVERLETELPPWGDKSTPMSLTSLKRCFLRRSNLEVLTQKGYFERYVKGMFVRVRAKGTYQGRQGYLCCRIAGIQSGGRVYELSNKSTTTLRLRLAIGNGETVYKVSLVSDQSVTEQEFQIWLRRMRKDQLEVPCHEQLLYLRREAERYRKNYKHTSEDIERLVQERQKLGFVANPTMEMERLKREILRVGDTDAELRGKYEQRLRNIEQQRVQEAKIFAESAKSRPNYINDMQRQKNLRRAELIRKKSKKRKSNDGESFDPFSRTQTVSTGHVVDMKADMEKKRKLDEQKKRKEEAAKREKEKKRMEKRSKSLEEILQMKPDSSAAIDKRPGPLTIEERLMSNPEYRKMRALCIGFPINIDLNQTEGVPLKPGPVRPELRPDYRDRTLYDTIISVQQYMEERERDYEE